MGQLWLWFLKYNKKTDISLFSYVLLIRTCASVFSAELGDCEPLEHNLDLVSEFRFIPNQTEDVELAIYNAWQTCR